MHCCLSQAYKGFIHLGCFLKPYFLLVIRLFWGYTLFKIGMGKLGDIGGTTELFQKLQIPYPELSAWVVALFETLGGAALFLGLFARLFSIPLIIIFITALFTAHFPETKEIFQNHLQFAVQPPVTFLLVSLAVLCFGPGAFSIDALFKKRCCHCTECTTCNECPRDCDKK
jgi:putative oxidoreductase